MAHLTSPRPRGSCAGGRKRGAADVKRIHFDLGLASWRDDDVGLANLRKHDRPGITIAVPRHRQLSPGVGAVDSEGRRLVSRRSCMAVSGADPSRGVDLRMQIRNGCKLLTVAFESVSPMPPKSPLYERDFFAWSRERAELLRAGKQRASSPRPTSSTSPRKSTAWGERKSASSPAMFRRCGQ